MPIRMRANGKVYVLTHQLIVCDHFEAVTTDDLKNYYNNAFASEGIDASVAQVKKIRTTYNDNLELNTWVSESSPIGVGTVIGLIIMVATVTAGVIITLSYLSSFIERHFPAPKFWSPDGKVFANRAEYVTYMCNIYGPSVGMPYCCHHCGNLFSTPEARDKHEAECPWKAGAPGEGDLLRGIATIAFTGITLIGGIYILPKLIDVIRGK